MKIARYCPDTVTFRPYEGRNKEGDPIYGPEILVKARVEQKNKWQRAKGENVLVEVTNYMTEQPLKLGDLINGDEIYAVEHIPNVKGKTIGYEGFPRPPIGFTP